MLTDGPAPNTTGIQVRRLLFSGGNLASESVYAAMICSATLRPAHASAASRPTCARPPVRRGVPRQPVTSTPHCWLYLSALWGESIRAQFPLAASGPLAGGT